MSDKLTIEQLINSNLGEAKVAPSPDIWKHVQRKLRRKQFMRFNPGKSNIYYVAGILIIGGGAVALLTGSPEEDDTSRQNPEPVTQIREIKTIPDAIDSEGTEEIKREPATQTEDKSTLAKDDIDNEVNQQAGDFIVEDIESSSAEVEIPNEGDNSSLFQEKEEASQNSILSYFSSSPQSGCAPLTVDFLNQSVNSTSSSWNFGADEITNVENPTFTFTEAGKYLVTLTSENSPGQSSIYQQLIEVYPSPKAAFEIEEGFKGLDGHVAFDLVNYSEGANSYSWNLLEARNTLSENWASIEFQPSVNLSDLKTPTKRIRLVATNENGCVDTSTQAIPIRIESSQQKIKFPNAFGPNPMGSVGGNYSPYEKRTDIFYPIFNEVPREYHLKIYTRRGEIIFQTRNIYEGWDGYYQEERALGAVYVWIVEGIWENGEEFKLQGDVTLIWKEIW